MTNKTTEALKLAEEALSNIVVGRGYSASEDRQALAALGEALAEQEKQDEKRIPAHVHILKEMEIISEQKPVAWVNAERNTITWEKIYPNMEPLYAAPVSAKREWVELTDYEIEELPFNRVSNDPLNEYARAVIAEFKEKNK